MPTLLPTLPPTSLPHDGERPSPTSVPNPMMQSRLLSLSLAMLVGLAFPASSAELGVLAPLVIDGKPQEQAGPDDAWRRSSRASPAGALFDSCNTKPAKDSPPRCSHWTNMPSACRRHDAAPHVAVPVAGGRRLRAYRFLAAGRQGAAFRCRAVRRSRGRCRHGRQRRLRGNLRARTRARVPASPAAGPAAGYSRTPHHSFSITDRPTAFDEGFATHFQALVRHLTKNPKLRLEDDGIATKPFVPYWLSNLDRTARIDGVRRNGSCSGRSRCPVTIRRSRSTAARCSIPAASRAATR